MCCCGGEAGGCWQRLLLLRLRARLCISNHYPTTDTPSFPSFPLLPPFCRVTPRTDTLFFSFTPPTITIHHARIRTDTSLFPAFPLLLLALLRFGRLSRSMSSSSSSYHDITILVNRERSSSPDDDDKRPDKRSRTHARGSGRLSGDSPSKLGSGPSAPGESQSTGKSRPPGLAPIKPIGFAASREARREDGTDRAIPSPVVMGFDFKSIDEEQLKTVGDSTRCLGN